MAIVGPNAVAVNRLSRYAAATSEQPSLPLGLEPHRADAAARSLLVLLGGSAHGAVQDAEGGYRGRQRLDVDTLAAHFRGEISVALRCADGDTARIIAWDLDERAPERMRALGRVLERHNLLEAAIGTEGSDAGRGKVVLFVRGIAQTSAVTFAEAILRQARREPEWGIERDGTVEARPRIREGGLLRIGGRNAKRQGPMERVFALATGEAIAFSQIALANLDLPAEPQAVPTPRVPPYVAGMLKTGLTWPTNGSAGIRKVLARIARHAVRSGRGEAVFFAWCETIREKSPALASPSPKNRDVRGALSPARIKTAWRAALENQTKWDTTPSGLPKGDDVVSHPGADDEENVYAAVLDFVRVRDLHQDGFELSYRELQRRLGWKRMKTWRVVQRLVTANRLVILDRGTQGERGDRTIFALSGGRNAADVAAASKKRPVVAKRSRKRKEHNERLAGRVVTLDDRRLATKPKTQTESPSPPTTSSSGDAMRHPLSGAGRGPRRAAHDGEGRPPRAVGAEQATTDIQIDFGPIFVEAAAQRRGRRRSS